MKFEHVTVNDENDQAMKIDLRHAVLESLSTADSAMNLRGMLETALKTG